jgi:hypothetical protein
VKIASARLIHAPPGLHMDLSATEKRTMQVSGAFLEVRDEGGTVPLRLVPITNVAGLVPVAEKKAAPK